MFNFFSDLVKHFEETFTDNFSTPRRIDVCARAFFFQRDRARQDFGVPL